jgi:hypothetical protein
MSVASSRLNWNMQSSSSVVICVAHYHSSPGTARKCAKAFATEIRNCEMAESGGLTGAIRDGAACQQAMGGKELTFDIDKRPFQAMFVAAHECDEPNNDEPIPLE